MQSNDAAYQQSNPKLTVTHANAYGICSELNVLYMLNSLKTSSPDTDMLPYWFLKLLSNYVAKPVAYLFNLSLITMTVPAQWKQAVITPLPKINKPVSCSDFRPISLTPILSRLLEKIVVRNFIYPALNDPAIHPLLTDQFAFRPTGSTDATLISILHHITDLLTTNPY